MSKEIKSPENSDHKSSEKAAPFLRELSEDEINQKADLELFAKEFNVNYRTVRYPKLLAAIIGIGIVFLLWKAVVMPEVPVQTLDQDKKIKEFLAKNKKGIDALIAVNPEYASVLLKRQEMTEQEKAIVDALKRREALEKKFLEEKQHKK